MSDRRARERPVFTYEEALATLPVIRDLTDTTIRQIEALFNRVQSQEEMQARRGELKSAYDALVEAWTLEVEAVGCTPKGLWLVDWDSGDGFYCWKYPEKTLGYFHGYEDGFAGRVPIA